MSRQKFSRSRILLLVGAPFLVLFATWYIVYASPLPFIASWWHAGETDWDDAYYRRNRMADTFILTGRLIGMPRARVVELLGEPTPTEYFQEWDIVYNLGAERGMGVDSEWLVMRVDANGVVVEAAVVSD